MDLEKLKALIDKGVGGERENAKRILKKILQKQGKVYEDFVANKEKEDIYYFKYKTLYEKRLLTQIVCYVLDISSFGIVRNKGSIGIKLTAYKYIEISTIYNLLKPKLKQELNITFKAFIIKNYLFSKSAEKDSSPMSEEDFKILRRARDIEKTELHKQLTTPKLTGGNTDDRK